MLSGNIAVVCFINSQIPFEVYDEPVLNQLLATILNSLTKPIRG